MHATQRLTTEDIIAAYQQTGSVWKAAKLLGIAGQTVHSRLQAANYRLVAPHWTAEEIAELRSLVEHETITEIASRLGRPYNGVACKISDLGIGVRHGNRVKVKIPRGVGYDKVSLRKHMKAIDADPTTLITRYARSNGLGVEMLIQSIERHYPEWWQAYRRAHSDLPEKTCPGCNGTFVPSSGKQTYCTRQCAGQHRRDRDYFGGQRANTHGLASGMCQICGRKPKRGLSSHHVFGKENDPENLSLIALCTGCHQLVTLLGGRDWDEANFEALVTYAWMRKHGPELASGELGHGGLRVCIDIDWDSCDEGDDCDCESEHPA